jgi:hypothetical protein
MRQITWILLLFFAFGYSQKTIKGKVLEATTSEALPFVNLFSSESNQGVYTNAEGKFDKAPAQKPSQNQEVKPKTTSNPDPKIKAKKQAAGITKGSKTDSKPDTDFNPLALSDEEFEKMFGNKL